MASRTDSANSEVSSGNSRLSRRLWLASSAAALGSTLLQGSSGAPLAAAEPPTRTGRPFMKLSLAAYSFNRYLPRNWPKPRSGNPTMTLEDFVDYCAEQDLDATELTSYYFPADVTNEYLMSIKNQTFRLGLDISGTAIGNDFCLPEGPDREFQLEMTRKWIDYAALMGAPVIRIFAGKVPKGETEEVALDRCVEGINQSLDYAATKGVVLALENHGGITATPEQLLRIVERVNNSPWFGINFDSGNFRTDDPYGDLEKIAPYAVNAQVKVAITAGGEKQEADLPRIVGILQDAGYRGYLVLEYEEKEDPREAIPRYLEQLRKLTA
ncbi:Xylose isomerase-like TIM barrel [Maioricimonas rarisocia]|uniref:Xylose isomerase-like TIM barrel n=1 Tax=Maioricimonas rarisocia TaxID=2528026 RepID=A0A517Z6B8_9PLAN|nr:sugar phosphate isomerase/epimerase family protein [Maioricimonas rarisocia]QDU37979.1 Xylose isomerase-like TIM barrel [Maioricimonas rarisocia]